MGWCHGSWRTPGTPGSLLAEALSRSKSDEVVLALINTLEMSKARRYQYEWSFNMVTPDMTLPAFLHLFEAIVSRNRAACVGMAMLQHCPEDPASLSTSRTLAHTALKSRAPALLSITLVRRFIEAFDLSANYFSACSSCSEDFKDCSRRDPGLYFDLSLDNADSTFAAVLERRAHVPESNILLFHFLPLFIGGDEISLVLFRSVTVKPPTVLLSAGFEINSTG